MDRNPEWRPFNPTPFEIIHLSHHGTNYIRRAHAWQGTIAGSTTGGIKTHPGGLTTPHGELSLALLSTESQVGAGFIDPFLGTRDGFVTR